MYVLTDFRQTLHMRAKFGPPTGSVWPVIQALTIQKVSRTIGNDQAVLYSNIHWLSHGAVLVILYSVVTSQF